MAKIVLTISADNKATQSVRLLNAEVQTLSKTLSTIKVNKNLTAQINALTKYYNNLTKAAVKINEVTSKRQLVESKIATQEARTATEKARKITQLKQEALLTERINTEKTKQAVNEAKVQNSVKITTSQTQRLVKQYADLLNTIKSLEKSYKKGTFDNVTSQIKSYFNEVKGLDDELKSGKITQADYDNKIIQATASLQGFKTEVASTRTESKSLHGTLKDTVSGFLQFQLSAMLVMKPLQLIRGALSSINETLVKTEDAVIALQRVLPNGSASDDEISSRLYKIAADYGQTFENVSEIAQNFARSGMSWADTIKATESAALALNVAELDATEATNGMIAIMSQFNLEASDLETVIDKLNKTADNFPVTTEKILAALQRTGSAASNANLSLDETISLITALSKATGRSGENIGTALNSLIQYSSKSSALETFANLSDEAAQVVENYRKGLTKANGETYNILDVWQQVSKEIQNIDSRQADLLDSYFATEDGSALKDALDGELEDIYTELGGVYDTANTFRKNYFIALLGNMDTVLQAQQTLAGAQGYSQTENEKYLDTYTAKLNTLKAEWEDIANSEQGLLGLKKFFVDLGSGILAVVNATGGLRTTFIALGSVLATLFAPKIISGLNKIDNFFKNLPKPLKNFQLATKASTKAQQAQTAATFAQMRADNLATRAKELRTLGTEYSALAQEFETRATQQQTIATQAQTKADKIAAVAAKAKGAAIQTAIGIIGIAVTAISSVVGAVQEANRVAEENRKQTIENYRNIEETYTELQKLSKQYKDLADTTNRTEDQEKNFSEIENQLIEVLKDKYKVLSLLTEGTDEYNEAVKRLADEELAQYGQELVNAQSAAQTNLEKTKIGRKAPDDEWGKIGSDYNYIKDILKKRGIETSGIARDHVLDLAFSNSAEAQLYNFAQYKQGYNALYEAYLEAIKAGDNKTADRIINSTQWKNFDEVIKKYEQVIKDYLDTTVANTYFNNYKQQFGEITTQAEFDNALEWITKSINAGEYYNDTIKNILAGLVKISDATEDTTDATSKWSNDISNIDGKYDDLIKKLEELRDLQKESTDWEEKKLAVLEAEQALENARNEATVRRFNQDTNQWEWQTDEKAIAEAEENLEKAQLDLQEAAYDSIITQLEEQTATNESILAILKEVTPLLGEDFANAVKGAISGTTSVDLDNPIISKDGSYDSGGIANGLGFMPKATAQPESVNDPELTKKILTPVSNAEFDRYVKDMGIMFAQAHNFAQIPQFERVNTTNDNRVDNSGQITMNGVTIGSNARGNTLDELLTLAKIVPNT